MLVEQIIDGIVPGSMYALVAQCYTLVFGVLDKLKFATAPEEMVVRRMLTR